MALGSTAAIIEAATSGISHLFDQNPHSRSKAALVSNMHSAAKVTLPPPAFENTDINWQNSIRDLQI
jgi:hypothetical protein